MHQDTSSSISEAATRFDRRAVVGGVVGAGLATAGIARLATAQSSTDSATPDASTAATPEPSSSDTSGSTNTAMAEERIARAQERLDAATADRDAVSGEVDTATSDALLADGTTLLAAAQASLDAGDTGEAIRQASATGAAATASTAVLVSLLTFPGLPSQESAAARALAGAFDQVGTAADDAADVTAVDAAALVTTAQGLYSLGYDQYGSGAYAQALGNARAAASVAKIVTVLASTREGEGFGGPGGNRDDQRDKRNPEDGTSPDTSEPVTVPEPDF